jgi:hypothetical protein
MLSPQDVQSKEKTLFGNRRIDSSLSCKKCDAHEIKDNESQMAYTVQQRSLIWKISRAPAKQYEWTVSMVWTEMSIVRSENFQTQRPIRTARGLMS